MKKGDTVLIPATVDAMLRFINTHQIRVKIGEELVWIDAENVIESGIIMMDEEDEDK